MISKVRLFASLWIYPVGMLLWGVAFASPAAAQTEPGGILCSVRGYVGQYLHSSVGESYSIELDGRTGYFLHFDDVQDDTQLVVVDFTVPLSPVVLGTYPIGSSVYEISLIDGVVYASIDDAGVGIFDVSDPSNIVQAGVVELDAFNPRYAVAGDRMYVADDSDILRIVDIADPASPVVLSAQPLAGRTRAIVAEGDRVYVAIDTDELLVFDVSDPTDPVLLETFSYNQFWFPHLAMDSGLIVIGDGAQFQVIETIPGADELVVRSETAIYELGDGLGHHRISSIELDGSDLYIGTEDSTSMLEVSIEDPSAPVLRGLTGIVGYEGYDFAVDGQGFVIVSAFDMGLCMLDMNLADRSIPFSDEWLAFSQVENFDSFYMQASAIEDGVLYASYQTYDFIKEQRQDGVLALDVQDPANPVIIGSYLNNLDIVDFLEVKDQILYLSRYGNELEVVDFSDPSDPVQLLHYQAFPEIVDLGLDGDTLWMQVGRNEHALLDVSDPLNLSFKAFYKLHSNDYADALFSDGLLYLSHAIEQGEDELPLVSVVDLANPFNPARVDYPAPTLFEVIQTNNLSFYGVNTAEGMLFSADANTFSQFLTAPLIGEGSELVVAGGFAYWNASFDRVLVYDLRGSGGAQLIGTQSPSSNEFSIATDGEQMILVSYTGTVGVSLDPSCVLCPADLDSNGELNYFDVAAFIAGYLNEDPRVDLDGDGSLTFYDVSRFLEFYAQGCP